VPKANPIDVLLGQHLPVGGREQPMPVNQLDRLLDQ
jgi:hypothetical protein